MSNAIDTVELVRDLVRRGDAEVREAVMEGERREDAVQQKLFEAEQATKATLAGAMWAAKVLGTAYGKLQVVADQRLKNIVALQDKYDRLVQFWDRCEANDKMVLREIEGKDGARTWALFAGDIAVAHVPNYRDFMNAWFVHNPLTVLVEPMDDEAPPPFDYEDESFAGKVSE